MTHRKGRRWPITIGVMMVITAAGAFGWFRQESDVDIRTMAENGTVVSHDGTVIAFSKLGHGPPLILVDGAFCFRDNGPTPQLAPLLAQRFTVYVYDRRGRGESGDTTPYAIEREVEDLGALIDAAGGSAFVFGMSSGAGIVLRAVQNGMSVRKIALYEPPWRRTAERSGELTGRSGRWVALRGDLHAGFRQVRVR